MQDDTQPDPHRSIKMMIKNCAVFALSAINLWKSKKKGEKSKFSTRIKKNENIDRAHDNDNGYEDDAAKCTQMLLPFERRISLASDCVCVAVFGN